MSAVTPTSPGFPLSVASGGSLSAFTAGPSSASGSPRGTSRPTTPLSAGLQLSGPTYEDVRKWDDAEITAWLQSARLAAHASTFAQHDIRGLVLLDVDQSALKEMGIPSVGDRVRIFAAIKALNKRCAEAAALRRANSSNTSPHATYLGLSHSNRAHPDGEMEFLEIDHSDSARVDGNGDVNGTLGLNSVGVRRGQMRPPPLMLKQSASRGLPGYSSPATTLNNAQGFGLNAARGLAHGTSRAPVTSRNLASTSKPVSSSPNESTSLHRKVNSFSSSTSHGLGGTSPSQSKSSLSGGLSASGRIHHAQAGLSARPNTATGAGQYSSLQSRNMVNNSPSSSSSSPTTAGFNIQVGRPSTTAGMTLYGSGMASLNASSNHGTVPTASYSPLTPITEASSYSTTPTTPGGLQLQQQQQQQPLQPLPLQQSLSSSNHHSNGYVVGRGPFASASRPITPGKDWASKRPETSDGYYSTSSLGLSANYNQPPPTLEDLKRRTIKFISEEDRTTRIVNVSDCRDAYDVMARVLKKFGKPASANSYTPTADQGPTGDQLGAIETWGIFATSADGQNTKALSDNELLAICHAPQPHDPLRERGLTLRRLPSRIPGDHSGKVLPRSGRNKLEAFFGERMPVSSMNLAPPGSPHDQEGDAGSITISGKKMKRASTVSIMSGLGVGPFSAIAKVEHRHGNNGKKDVVNLNAKPGQAAPKPSKIRNFFGQRPPSELINTNLADFFPSTEPKALQRTARRSVYGRASASTRSKRNSTWSFAADTDAPPLPYKESLDIKRSGESTRGQPTYRDNDGTPVIHIGFDSRPEEITERKLSTSGPPMLPPVVGRSSLEDWSRGLQAVGSPISELSSFSNRSNFSRPGMSRRASGESARSRKSLASQIRHGLSAARERGDAVSLLTVDEITQEVESRRESINLARPTADWVVDEDGVPIPIPGGSARSSSIAASTRPSSGISARSTENAADASRETRRPSADAPRPSLDEGAPYHNSPTIVALDEESDPHLQDPIAIAKSVASQSGSFMDLSDQDDLSAEDVFSDDTEDDDDEDDQDGGDIYQSHPDNKASIKWHKGALIGAGSFGNVYLGMNAKTGLLMAVKQVGLPSGDSHLDQRKKTMLEALEREIKLLKTLQHDNIVQYLDSFANSTHLNIFLEYVPGGSIVALLRNYGAFEEPLVRNFVRQILHGLSFLHAKEIVHRDIKGANILVDNKGVIKISDFGISKKVESDLLISARAHRPSLQGSVFWMAPEVVKQTSYTRKADIWSLGCLVVEMISGTHPWAELNQMQALFQIGLSRKPALPDEISEECTDFLNKTFELDHNLRPSADELLEHAFITEEFKGITSDESSNGGSGNGVTYDNNTLGTSSSQNALHLSSTSPLTGESGSGGGNKLKHRTTLSRREKKERKEAAAASVGVLTPSSSSALVNTNNNTVLINDATSTITLSTFQDTIPSIRNTCKDDA